MLTGPTLDKVITLNLGGMAQALAEQRETPAHAELDTSGAGSLTSTRRGDRGRLPLATDTLDR